MSRVRSIRAARVSFFSFQDIITSVTGILILATLILTLYLSPPPVPPASLARIEEALEAAQSALDRAVSENTRLLERLLEAETAPSAERLNEDLGFLRSELEASQIRIRDLQAARANQDESARRRAIAFGIEERQRVADEILREVERLESERKSLSRELSRLEGEMEAITEQVEQRRRNARQVWWIPEPDTSGKQPFLVTAGGGEVATERFNQPDSRRVHQGGPREIEGWFRRRLESLNPEKDYVVFMIRPSGIERFRTLRAIVQEAGFEMGHDAVEEHQVLIFREPQEP